VALILTLEDHVLKGGFGAAIIEELSDLRSSTPVVRVGWPDQFIDHGKPDDLRAKHGLSVEGALEKMEPYLAKIKAAKPAIAVA
jgi:1-deoxy-D-xylulose-5-phosphate synthase